MSTMITVLLVLNDKSTRHFQVDLLPTRHGWQRSMINFGGLVASQGLASKVSTMVVVTDGEVAQYNHNETLEVLGWSEIA